MALVVVCARASLTSALNYKSKFKKKFPKRKTKNAKKWKSLTSTDIDGLTTFAQIDKLKVTKTELRRDKSRPEKERSRRV